ncbi:MAG: GLUG motif-containing protein, partial [Planctomycetota bacterium]
MYSLSRTIGLSVPREQGDKLAILLFVLFAIYFFPLSAQAQYGGGSGTENDPYLIYTAEQMNEIGAEPADWNKHFKLMNNIDLSEYAGFGYNIIGTSAFESFDGVFDGNGHTISNFGLTSTRDLYTGLFGYVQGQIKNLGLIDPNIFAQGSGVGPLVGFLDQGTIIDCYAKGASVLGDRNVGGLVGLCSGRIDNCYSSGSVFGYAYVGGLVGRIGDGTVNKSFSTASVEGNQDVGGFVGKTSEETSVISNCYATGSVSGSRYVGGLVGQVERGAAHKCFSAGSVSGNLDTGGLAGYLRVLGQISHCFWDVQTSGQLTSAGGTGKTTEEMQM